jgi:hypothetical protein
MIKRLIGILALGGVILALLPLGQAAAARGTPGSSEFGYGAHLDLQGQFVDDGIQLANNLQLDWINLEISWKTIQPAKENLADWSQMDRVFALLGHYHMSVLASLVQPPAWAVTKNGPDPALTAKFLKQFVERYPTTINAIELFPGANTHEGWSAAPDPAAYMVLWKTVTKTLGASKTPILLIAAGLVSQVSTPQACMDDLEFLQGLYKAGARDLIQVFSVQLADIVGTPVTSPSQNEHRVLRHYEEIRDIMVSNQHDKALLWITKLSAPLVDQEGDPQAIAQKQSAWLAQAFQQLRSQLYIGVAFFNRINPPQVNSDTGNYTSLITLTGDLHPVYRVLRDQIAQNSSGGMDPRPGRPKSETLIKNH